MQSTITGSITFTRPEDVYPDPVRKGLLRAKTQPGDTPYQQAFELRDCPLQDWSADDGLVLGIDTLGFDCIDLARFTELQKILETIRCEGRVDSQQAAAIRGELRGQVFKVARGKRLKILSLGDEGFIMRRAGLNGSIVAPDEQMSQMNGHDGALAVHADQDVKGTPLRQILKGQAGWLFRHDSPHSRNQRSPLIMMNLWIPLQQISRPLSFMDSASLDRKRHQLCYALPTEGFLERDASLSVNDTWAFLFDDQQRWYFNPDMNASQAYVFNTLSTPHGAMILPGEAEAQQLHQQLQTARKAIATKDLQALQQLQQPQVPTLPADTTAPLRAATEALYTLLAQARQCAEKGQLPQHDWLTLADLALDRLVRKSIEVRGVGLLTRDIWPLNTL